MTKQKDCSSGTPPTEGVESTRSSAKSLALKKREACFVMLQAVYSCDSKFSRSPWPSFPAIGAGGMGEVYRARDTKLNRDVALKILPDAFAKDAERMARFEREAQVLAALNHPNIAAIYGIEDRALVMELVEGESPQGPLPLETALDYAHQIADALE